MKQPPTSARTAPAAARACRCATQTGVVKVAEVQLPPLALHPAAGRLHFRAQRRQSHLESGPVFVCYGKCDMVVRAFCRIAFRFINAGHRPPTNTNFSHHGEKLRPWLSYTSSIVLGNSCHHRRLRKPPPLITLSSDQK